MKILYGVQGTGNGHVSRARAMQKEFAKTNIKVDWLFSGRSKGDYFDMQDFSNAKFQKGLTLTVENGKVKYLKTAFNLDLKQFRKDIKKIDSQHYDLIISDFEPITAWAGKRGNAPVIGLGHQYVFDLPVPKNQGNLFSQFVLKHYAPVKESLALHWHHFNQNILPPIVETHSQTGTIENKVIVYLPFENQYEVLECLKPIKRYDFIVYSPNPINSNCDNIQFKPLSREGFLNDLYDCDAVIANAGFELSSEVISLGKRLLVKPLNGQVEQFSNAIALKKLLYGTVMHRLSSWEINRFLKLSVSVQVNYPNVAKYIVRWIDSGMPYRDHDWYLDIWNNVKVKRGFAVSNYKQPAYV